MKNQHSSVKPRHQNHATLSVVLYVIAAFIAVFAVYTTFAAGSNLIAYASIQEQDISFLTDIVPAVFQQSFPMYAYALIFLTCGKTYDKIFAVYNTIFPRKSSATKEAVKPEDSEPKEVKAEAQEEIVPEESMEKEEIVQDFVERCTEEESGESEVAVTEEKKDTEEPEMKEDEPEENAKESRESEEEIPNAYSEERSEEKPEKETVEE